jgi:hypothetical protein
MQMRFPYVQNEAQIPACLAQVYRKDTLCFEIRFQVVHPSQRAHKSKLFEAMTTCSSPSLFYVLSWFPSNSPPASGGVCSVRPQADGPSLFPSSGREVSPLPPSVFKSASSSPETSPIHSSHSLPFPSIFSGILNRSTLISLRLVIKGEVVSEDCSPETYRLSQSCQSLGEKREQDAFRGPLGTSNRLKSGLRSLSMSSK